MTIDEQISAELRSHAPEVDEDAAWGRIRTAAPVQRRARTIRLVMVPVVAVGLLVVGSILLSTLPSGPEPASDPQSPLLGTWVTTDLDGSTPTMVIQVSGGESVEMLVHDDFASVCSGAPSTMTGTGRFQGDTEFVFPAPVLTCDDGSQPKALTGPPLDEQLQNLTFVHDPESGTLTDNLGLDWTREGADPSPEPTTEGGMWPQSSLEEVREAQRLADAGDPNYTWQLEPALEENLLNLNGDYLGRPEIFARFLQEELHWEEFYRFPGVGFGDGTIMLTFVRCAPGQRNSIYPHDPSVGKCAPTIDDVLYETVEITVAQIGVRGTSGIWVVTQRENLEPVEQVVPLTESEATAIVESFLQARIDGEGADQYFGGGGGTAPLLYATSTGIPYARSELELTDGPEWPAGWIGFEVRLFTDDSQTIVEQSFSLERDAEGRWGLETGSGTLENGQEAFPGLRDILGGEVTFQVTHPWDDSIFGNSFDINGQAADALLVNPDGYMKVLADPLPIMDGCEEGPAPADAETLAQSILSDDDFEGTAPLSVTIGGAPALQMDLVNVAGASACDAYPRSAVTTSILEPGSRMRLYLVDLPGGSARILSIAIVAESSRFDRVVEQAVPILDSFEFHTG